MKSDLAALLGALLWATHPVQVESIGWASGLKDVLSGSLVLAALVAFVRYRQEERRRFYVVALIVYAFAMLAKPSAFTMPLLVIVIERLLLRTPWRKVWLALAPLVLATIPIALIARSAQPALGSTAPGWVRSLVVGDTLSFYALKIIAPIHLVFDYGRTFAVLRAGRELYIAWLLPAGTLAILATAYFRRRRAGCPLPPLPAAALLIFALAPLHVLGATRFDFQVISTVADHYLYVAMIGPALMLAWVVARWPRSMVAAAVLVTAYGARAAWQTRVWEDSKTLFSHTLRLNPLSWTSYVNLSLIADQQHDEALSRSYLTQAERIAPDDATVLLNLVALSVQQGDRDRTIYYSRRLIEVYRRIWRQDGWSPAIAHVSIIGLLMNANRLDLADEFIRDGQAADPNEPALAAFAEQLKWKRRALPPIAPTTMPSATTTPATMPSNLQR